MNDDAPYDDAPQQCPQYTTEKGKSPLSFKKTE
jgi:hypothetical protein